MLLVQYYCITTSESVQCNFTACECFNISGQPSIIIIIVLLFKRHFCIKYDREYAQGQVQSPVVTTYKLKKKANKKNKAPYLVIISENNSAWIVTSRAPHANNHK